MYLFFNGFSKVDIVSLPDFCSFDKLLAHLEASIAKGKAVVDYIKKIDQRLYTRHSFPLPRFGKVASNPTEQANFGLLGIHHFAPFKILVEIWYYI